MSRKNLTPGEKRIASGFSMSAELIAHVDAAARVLDISRSSLGRRALRAFLAALPAVERAAIEVEIQRAARAASVGSTEAA